MRPSPLAPQRQSPLRTGRRNRRAHVARDRRRPRFEQPMLSIHQRPESVADRSEAGHWEGDLIVGKGAGSAIGTLVERKTRMIRLLHLTRRDGQTLRQALIERMGDLPPDLLRSITWDQGAEMAQHRAITAALGVPVYFCDSRSPWQRGSNENSNGRARAGVSFHCRGCQLRVHRIGVDGDQYDHQQFGSAAALRGTARQCARRSASAGRGRAASGSNDWNHWRDPQRTSPTAHTWFWRRAPVVAKLRACGYRIIQEASPTSPCSPTPFTRCNKHHGL